jgi:hypothetical protein
MTVHSVRPNRLFVLLAMFSLAVLGSVAWAAIPDAGGTFHACANANSGVLRLIDTEDGETCNPNESEVSWSQSGPQGPPGLAGMEKVTGEIVTIDASNSFDFSFVNCPTGKKAISGGWDTTNFNSPDIAVTDNEVLGDHGWIVDVLWTGGGTGHYAFRAWATCASVSP